MRLRDGGGGRREHRRERQRRWWWYSFRDSGLRHALCTLVCRCSMGGWVVVLEMLVAGLPCGGGGCESSVSARVGGCVYWHVRVVRGWVYGPGRASVVQCVGVVVRAGARVEQSQVWLPPPRTLAIPHQLLAAASALVFTCGIVGASVCAARGVCTSVLAACAHCRRLSLASGEGWLVGWCRCLLVAWLAASPDSIALITSRGARSGRLRWRR